MAKYYCILFDADNTLLNFDAAENKALAETLVNYGIEPDAETVQTYRTINEELWRQLEKARSAAKSCSASGSAAFKGHQCRRRRRGDEPLLSGAAVHPPGPDEPGGAGRATRAFRGGNAGHRQQRCPEGADPPSGGKWRDELYGRCVHL